MNAIQVPYSSKFSRSKTSVIQPAQLLTDNIFIAALIDTPIGVKIFVDKIFVIYLHLTKITKLLILTSKIWSYTVLQLDMALQAQPFSSHTHYLF